MNHLKKTVQTKWKYDQISEPQFIPVHDQDVPLEVAVHIQTVSLDFILLESDMTGNPQRKPTLVFLLIDHIN